MQDGAVCGFKYLQFTGEEQEIAVTYRGEFTGKILVYTEESRENQIAEIQISPAKDWHRKKEKLKQICGKCELYFEFCGEGSCDFDSFYIR